MNYPTMKEVESADHIQLAKWYRFLTSPGDETKREILNRIVERFYEFGGMTKEISKLIGIGR